MCESVPSQVSISGCPVLSWFTECFPFLLRPSLHRSCLPTEIRTVCVLFGISTPSLVTALPTGVTVTKLLSLHSA